MLNLSAVSSFDKTALWAVVFLLGCLGIVIWDQSFQWRLREDYYFGHLVPFLCAYVIYDRWPVIRASLRESDPPPSPVPPPASGLWDKLATAALFPALFFFALGAVMRAINGPNIIATYLNTGGFIAICLGTVWLFTEKNTAGRSLAFTERTAIIRLFVFPILVWFISGPLLLLMDTSVRTFLLLKVTAVVVEILNAIGMSVTNRANIIELPKYLPDGTRDCVGVADACSGVRSLTACIFMGSFLSAIFLNTFVRKLLLLFFSLIFALVLNLIRTTFLTMWAYKHGSKAIDGDLWLNEPKSPEFTFATVHDVAGYAAMGATFALLIALIPLLNTRLRIKINAPPNKKGALPTEKSPEP
ncbi:MAG: exosortase/archaeosortase family protein [Puniceicoccales bacterium]|jgi:exosortase/archaeosortase family protein|nr:exosortase/archaeosortase family protein [Puniceicoccales bacterium]